ncbi:CoA-transferase family III protein [Bordetella holmesii CDC-H572-BH]|nr:CoA-transferase family III protein [Bordetella holmesii CDC-H572-BH]
MDRHSPLSPQGALDKQGKHSLEALGDIWRAAALPDEALDNVALTGQDPVLPSSFAVGAAAQVSIAAAGLAAAELWHLRGQPRQRVMVDMLQAAQECRGHFTINGVAPPQWDKISGAYPCGDGGWVRIHAKFAHHRDGALALLGCPTGEGGTREAVAAALQGWKALEFEQVAAYAGLVVAAMRSFQSWDAHPQARALANQPLVSIERIDAADPRPLPHYGPELARPLQGIRVLDLTRIIAGPIAGRTLAAYGADVMLVNAPHLPNIDNIIETSQGKLSAYADLETADGRIALGNLLRRAHVFVQGYRPGGLEALGFGAQEAARIRPGIVYVSLSAYGSEGPWARRRGFDSLVQTATGLNQADPKPLPMQILDYASGFLMAFGAQAALMRQATEGGSWHVRVSLARTGMWLRSLGRVTDGLACPMPPIGALLATTQSGFGTLSAVQHAAQFSATPAIWTRPSVPPGTHPTVWPFQ